MLAVLLLLVPLAVAAPFHTSLCCCGCVSEPCPSLSDQCPPPTQPCASGGVPCPELQRLWQLAVDKSGPEGKLSSKLHTEIAASDGRALWGSYSLGGEKGRVDTREVVSKDAPRTPPPEVLELTGKGAVAGKDDKEEDEAKGAGLALNFVPLDELMRRGFHQQRGSRVTLKEANDDTQVERATHAKLTHILDELEDMIQFVKGMVAEQASNNDTLVLSRHAISTTNMTDADYADWLASPPRSGDDEARAIEAIIERLRKNFREVSELSGMSSGDMMHAVEATLGTFGMVGDKEEEEEERAKEHSPNARARRDADEEAEEEEGKGKEIAGSEPATSGLRMGGGKGKGSKGDKGDKEKEKGGKRDSSKAGKGKDASGGGGNCNDPKIREMIMEHIGSDAKTSKRAIQKALEKEFKGTFNVICSPCEFSFLISSQKYCEGFKDQMACFAFLQPPTK